MDQICETRQAELEEKRKARTDSGYSEHGNWVIIRKNIPVR